MVAGPQLLVVPQEPEVLQGQSQDRAPEPEVGSILGRKVELLELDRVGEKDPRVADFRSRDANFRVSEAFEDDSSGLEPIPVTPEHPLHRDLGGVGHRKVPGSTDHLPITTCKRL